MQPRLLDLNDVIANVEHAAAELIGDDIELQLELRRRRSGDVKADPGQLEQVLMNLAANARDAMPEGGRLTIATANDRSRPDDVAALRGDRGRALRAAHASRTPGPGFPTTLRRTSSSRSSRPRSRARAPAWAGDGLRNREAERRVDLPGRDAGDPAPRSGIYLPRVE